MYFKSVIFTFTGLKRYTFLIITNVKSTVTTKITAKIISTANTADEAVTNTHRGARQTY